MVRPENRFDLAIAGRGILPPLLALHMLASNVDWRILLLCEDDQVGGEQLEPVILARLSARARDLVEACCVAKWPGYYTIRSGDIVRHDEEVWLLDPVQLWLELETEWDRCSIVTGFRSEPDGALAERVIDLRSLVGPASLDEIVGVEMVRQLGLPVLADYDLAGPDWEAHQILPLGDERMLIRKLPLRQTLVSANSSLEGLLNALVED